MSLIVHLLNAGKKLTPFLSQIDKIYNQGIRSITSVLPIENVDIVIVENPSRVIPEIGIGGHTYSPNYIVISLDSHFFDFSQSLENGLIATLAHELHHAARWQAIGYGETLLDAMVSEGLADHFALEITGKKEVYPWNKALTREQTEVLMQKARVEFDNKNYNHSAWFFGSKENETPRWAAYTLGFNLVDAYLKNHPDSKASLLFNAESSEFK